MSIFLSFRQDIACIAASKTTVVFKSPIGEHRFDDTNDVIWAALQQIQDGKGNESELIGQIIAKGDFPSMQKFVQILRQITALGYICYSLNTDSGIALTLIPTASPYTPPDKHLDTSILYYFSRFAYLHTDQNQWVIESPKSAVQLTLHHLATLPLIYAFAQGASVETLQQSFPNHTLAELSEFTKFLLNAQIVVPENLHKAEEDPHQLGTWEFHDLLFHSRSRLGRHNNRYGGTYRFGGEVPIPPAAPPKREGQRIALTIPNKEELEQHKSALFTLMQRRRSIRNYGDTPLNIQQLGEFLYKVGRLETVTLPSGEVLEGKPYPSGGALYELEIYPIIQNCEGLDAGVYHYAADSHELVKINALNDSSKLLLTLSWITATRQSQPQVLFVITARFKRLSLKYQSVSYALILKHVGVLYHSMYLVATEMNLAPCALGGGSSDLFTNIIGNDYYEESAVGEFLLGSMR